MTSFKRDLLDLSSYPMTVDQAYATVGECLTAAREAQNGDRAGIAIRKNLTGSVLAMREPMRHRLRSLKERLMEPGQSLNRQSDSEAGDPGPKMPEGRKRKKGRQARPPKSQKKSGVVGGGLDQKGVSAADNGAQPATPATAR